MPTAKPKTADIDKYLIALHSFIGFGPVRFSRLKSYFAVPEDAWRADLGALRESGIDERTAAEFIRYRKHLDPDALIQKLEAERIEVLPQDSPAYPKHLKETSAPPPLLYLRGAFDLADDFALAVVGSRKFTSYGKAAVERLVPGLVRGGLTIVSGLALGIDALAHASALENGGRTIAVLACGIDRRSVYPGANRWLSEKIVEKGGVLVSEMPPGTPPLKHHFPQRNRIISGLALGTLVVEAHEKSGAQITASFALEQGREVFAVPGSIFSAASSGPNRLISQGAHVALASSDILEILGLEKAVSQIETRKALPQTEEEAVICESLKDGPRHIDELIRISGLAPSAANSTLTVMEIKGLVVNLGGMEYGLK